MPTMGVSFETAVEDVLPDGAAKLRITLLGVTVRDRPGSAVPSDMVQGQAEALRGVVITETLAPDGKVSDSHVEPAAALPDNAREQLDTLSRNLEQITMQLPREPVGPGARWRQRKALPDGGIHAVADTTYTLTSLRGSAVGYTSTGAASGDSQIIEQDGAKVRVTDTHGHSETTGSVDLSRYIPTITSTSIFATTLTMIAEDGGPAGPPSQIEISTAIQLTPTAAAPAVAGTSVPQAENAGSAAGSRDGSAQGAHKAP
jgi:hypothetical protein